MTKLLILSFSPLASDARLLKQIREFAGDYEVTTCGYGPQPHPEVEHLEVPASAQKIHSKPDLLLGRTEHQYWNFAHVAAAKPLLAGRQFDVILANDLDAVPLALSMQPRLGVHADLHEYFPKLHDDSLIWRLTIGRFNQALSRRYLKQAASVTTVSHGIAREYQRVFGVQAGVVTNAAPYQERGTHPTATPIRIVHSGAALRGRGIEEIVSAAAGLAGVTLDLYLTPNDPGLLSEISARAAESGNITLHDPVPYAQLGDTLAQYDVGVHLLAPAGFNHRHALPNKVFDYVQARLALVVSPLPEMAELVRSNGIGVVTAGPTAADLRASLAALSATQVDSYKQASAAAARPLGAENEIAKWRAAVDRIAGRA